MGVEKQDRRRSLLRLVGELHPSRDPRQGRIPAFAANGLGRLRQPEVSVSHLLEPGRLVEQRRHLSLLPPVVAADAGSFVAVEKPEDLVALESKGLLRAEEIGVKRSNRVGEELLPLRPSVHAVVGGAVTDVEAHDANRLSRCRRPGRMEHREASQHHSTDGEQSHRPSSVDRRKNGKRWLAPFSREYSRAHPSRAAARTCSLSVQ